jgi:hypothetical protein
MTTGQDRRPFLVGTDWPFELHGGSSVPKHNGGLNQDNQLATTFACQPSKSTKR